METSTRFAPFAEARAVLFDLDGTLADTAADLGAAINRMRVGRGLAPLADESLRPYASHGARGLLGRGFQVTPEMPEFGALRDEFLDHYATALCVRTTLFPGVEALLDAIERRGLRWGIVTNKIERFTLPILEALALRPRAGCIVSGDTAARAKPHPDPLYAAARRLGLEPACCIYVGDAARDVEAGVAAGMRTVVARYGYISDEEQPDTWLADAQILSPLDLLPLLPGWSQEPRQLTGA